MYGVKVQFSPTVVRGLSYYNGNVFEIRAKGVKETIVAGGSYMFSGVQATGISFGLDRLAIISKIDDKKEKYLVVSLNEDRKAIAEVGTQLLQASKEILNDHIERYEGLAADMNLDRNGLPHRKCGILLICTQGWDLKFTLRNFIRSHPELI